MEHAGASHVRRVSSRTPFAACAVHARSCPCFKLSLIVKTAASGVSWPLNCSFYLKQLRLF